MTHTTMFRLLTAALLVAIAAPSVQAQSMTEASTAAVQTQPTTTAALSDGPRFTQVGISRSTATTLPAPSLQNPSRRDVSWMVLGGAMIVIGSVVGGEGGDIIMITGGVVGLIGLWRFLQYS